MSLLVRLSRTLPLLAILAVLAGIVYVVVTYFRSPARAKEVLITLFTWLLSAVSVFFALMSLYAWFEGNSVVFDVAASFLLVGLIGLAITRTCNHVFLKHNPHYRSKSQKAKTHRRWPWKR